MTMMEEIAEALREAAFYAEQYVRQGGGTKRKQVAAASFYLNLAAKTEQMRCETCKYYVPGEDDEACKIMMLEFQGPNFYCNHWKEK